MKETETTQLIFFQKLGELFYAIAAADKVVRKAEYQALSQLVENEWKNLSEYKDIFDTDAAYQIAIVFEWFDYEKMDAEDCFIGFSDYYKSHKNLFNRQKKDLILKTAQKIASSFNGTNKSELIILARLQFLFREKVSN